MDSEEGVAAKRRVLVEALTMCLSRSKVSEHVNAETLRGVLDSASGEMWREGEFRLDTVWKILTQQPGLSAKEVAPPLFALKAYEAELGVAVRLPQALTAVPRAEQVRLRDELKFTKDDFAKAVNELQTLARSEQEKKAKDSPPQAGIPKAQSGPQSGMHKAQPASGALPATPAKKKPMNRNLAAGLMVAALAIMGTTLFFTLRDNSEPADFSDVASLLKVERGRRIGPSLAGTIDDARWDKLTVAERQRLAGQLFDIEVGKGVEALTLMDSSGAVRVTATNLDGHRLIQAR